MLLGALRRGKQPEDFVFTWENGEPVKDFRGTWDALTAGVPGLLFHDFRRSSVRNMIRRGVPQKTAREISGHKTDAIFDRYNIVSPADIQDAARKIEEGAKAANVIPTSFQLAPNQGNEELQENLQETTTGVHNQEVAKLSRSGGTGRRSRLKICRGSLPVWVRLPPPGLSLFEIPQK